MARAAKNIAGKDEEKEEYALTLGREGGPKAERTPGERDAEGSFGIGYLKPMQHVYRTKVAIVVNLRIVDLREQTICLLYGG